MGELALFEGGKADRDQSFPVGALLNQPDAEPPLPGCLPLVRDHRGERAVTLEELVTRWGVAAVFVGAGVEGETAAVTGGLLAHRHLIPLWASAMAACTGSFVADQCFFLTGRHYRDHPRVRALAAKPAFARALAALERHPTGFILSFRFLYGLRTISPLAIGGSSVPFARFMLLNAIAATAWGVIFTSLGYAFGKSIEALFGRLLTTRHVLMVVALLVVAVAIYGGVRSYRGRRRDGTRPGHCP